ncbi:hypothetical protein HJFPF1_02446 [Paramyrothecium foliicola]|nr:hypothetical protein HJFPF1_02446 [Paramyrothecium foliicola]
MASIEISSDESEPESMSESELSSFNTFEDWVEELGEKLDIIDTTGEFAVRKCYASFTSPGLRIGELGDIPLPLTVRDAGAIQNICRQAPFGKGTETMVDTTVRKTWELNQDQFQLANPQWPAFLQRVASELSADLGTPGLVLRLDKLLLYEEGSFFKKHKDSEKEKGMIGTVVICLPSQHQGGDVHLSIGSKERVLSTASASAFDLVAMAWFSDVTHEIKLVTERFRFVITYKAFHGGDGAISAQHVAAMSDDLERHMLKWQPNFPEEKVCGYCLEHQYTKLSLSLANMKGRDRAICQSLLAACRENGLFLMLGNITRRIPEDMEGEEEDGEPMLDDGAYSLAGKKVLDDLDLEIRVLNGIVEGGGRDHDDASEDGDYYGNEGGASTLIYHDTLALIVPKSHYQRLAKSYGLNSAHRSVNSFTGNSATYTIPRQIVQRTSHDPAISAIMSSLRDQSDPATAAVAAKSIESILTQGDSIEVDFRQVVEGSVEEGYESFRIALSNALVNSDRPRAMLDKEIEAFARAMILRNENDGLAKVLRPLAELCSLSMFRTLTPIFEHAFPEPQKTNVHQQLTQYHNDKISRQPVFNLSHVDYIYGTIESNIHDLHWLEERLLPHIISRGTPEVVQQTLVRWIQDYAKVEPTKGIVDLFLQRGWPKLAFCENDSVGRSVNGIMPPNGPSLGKRFTNVVASLLSIGQLEGADSIVRESCNRWKEPWLQRWSAPLVVGMVRDVDAAMAKYQVPPSEQMKDFFMFFLRQVLHTNLPKPPRQASSWAHSRLPSCIPVGRNMSRELAGLGQEGGCTDCNELNKFLASRDRVWQITGPSHRRKHISDRLDRSTYDMRTEKPLSRNQVQTLVVTKKHQAGYLEQQRYESDRQQFKATLQVLATPSMLKILGSDEYNELVLLQGSSSQSIGNGHKRNASNIPMGVSHDDQRRRF